jgi:hypothetical protein
MNNGHIITSVFNTKGQEVKIPNPKVQLIELEDNDRDAVIGFNELKKYRCDQSLRRGERVEDRVRNDHLNDEKRKSLFELCFDCQDVFYLPGDILSSTNATRNTIPLEPEVTP